MSVLPLGAQPTGCARECSLRLVPPGVDSSSRWQEQGKGGSKAEGQKLSSSGTHARRSGLPQGPGLRLTTWYCLDLFMTNCGDNDSSIRVGKNCFKCRITFRVGRGKQGQVRRDKDATCEFQNRLEAEAEGLQIQVP